MYSADTQDFSPPVFPLVYGVTGLMPREDEVIEELDESRHEDGRERVNLAVLQEVGHPGHHTPALHWRVSGYLAGCRVQGAGCRVHARGRKAG